MEKNGQKRRPSNRKETRKRSRKYLNTKGENVLGDLDAGFVSIYMILRV